MKRVGSTLRLSPTDLSAFLGCRHRTGLDLSVVRGLLDKPRYVDPMLKVLQEKGEQHETRYVESLRAEGLAVVDLRDARTVVETKVALVAGPDVIVQATLEDGTWGGVADILRRVDVPSALGDWSYEVYDTKLARETRGGTILQLSVYTELLGALQGRVPESFHVITPDPKTPKHSYRFAEFGAYYRLMKRRLLETIDLGPHEIRRRYYPDPVEQCGVCRWSDWCDRRRRDDDHLSFIAGIGRTHRTELEGRDLTTLAAVAGMPLPVDFVPKRGSVETYSKLREQARVQVEQRTKQLPVYETLPVEEGRGLTRLPEPSPGDVFLDLEGAQFAREGGREFLFGVLADEYTPLWATDDEAERQAFERVIERIMSAWVADPGMHVYHFANYEVTACKRLMGRYATRAEELDRLLRSGRFVDLHTVTRQAVRAGVESYTLKQFEQFHGFARSVELRVAGASLAVANAALESNAPDVLTDEIRASIAGYNEDDCRSTQSLRDWLEAVRASMIARGVTVPRPEEKDDDAPEALSERDQRAEDARALLLAGLPPEASEPAHSDHWRWLLAYLVDWHRREMKAAWWEHYRIRDVASDELFDEPKALAGLQFVETAEFVLNVRTKKPTGSVVDRYTFPPQENELGRGKVTTREVKFGDVVEHDRVRRVIDIRKGPAMADVHPSEIFADEIVSVDVLQDAVIALAERVAADDEDSCATELLLRNPPRLRKGQFALKKGEAAGDAALRVVGQLDRGVLAIQGPPGAGKTYVGAQMIRSLVRRGKRVGVTAVSHKVIENLLGAVLEQARASGETISVGHKGKKDERVDDVTSEGAIQAFEKNGDALDALASGQIQVLGATAWVWSSDAAAEAVDVLFVDEAGQMSLANVLSVSAATNSLVLLGDPQQLEQPQKGSHPDGVDISALEHILGGAKTMPQARGIFLPETWRLAPAICEFTSETFYEGKLRPRDDLAGQRLVGAGEFEGAGIWLVPVEHDGNQTSSPEEVDRVEQVVTRLLSGAEWIDRLGQARRIRPADIRVVAPYNAQVNRLLQRLGPVGVEVGTVDKFQGQEAPVLIYSMATSRPEDAPRGMEFLYSLNRLNVATSRARCAAIVVASPRLLEPECRTPRQMQFANAVCVVGESGRVVDIVSADTGSV